MKCPSCGMEIPDDSEICPYCTAHVRRRVRIKALYALAIVLVIVFVSYVSLAYTASEVEIVKVANLGINDNYNFIHVRGTVISYPKTYDSNYGVTQLSFTINDGTGDITVKIYRDLVEKVVKEGKVPGIGDTVDVQGTFSYGTRKSIIVNNVEFLRIEKSEFHYVNEKSLTIAAPWEYRNGETAYVVGNLTSVREYSFGYISTLDDSLDILIPHAYDSLNLVDLQDMGSGIVKLYGSLEFYEPISRSSDYMKVELSDLMRDPEAYNNTNVFILWAEVVDKMEDENIIVVNCNGTNVSVYSSQGVRYYDPGDHVQIQGKFVNYRGSWEIAVTRKNDFISEPGWELIMHPRYEVLERKEYQGENMSLYSFVQIQGFVADYRELSSGYLITLWLGNTTLQVYVENGMSIHGALDYGKTVEVKGIITLYMGEVELKVRAYTNDSVEVIS